MRVYSCAGMGWLVLASIIFKNPVWGIDRGWEAHRTCRAHLKDNLLCRKLAVDTFAKAFPALTYEWPTCGKDGLAEALLWVSIHDRVFVRRYMDQFRRLCP